MAKAKDVKPVSADDAPLAPVEAESPPALPMRQRPLGPTRTSKLTEKNCVYLTRRTNLCLALLSVYRRKSRSQIIEESLQIAIKGIRIGLPDDETSESVMTA